MRTAYRRFFDIGISVAFALITVGLALPHDVYRRFSANSDGDIIFVYNALLINDGLPLYYQVTAYTYMLALAGWFQVSHALGLVDVSTLTGLIDSKAVLQQFAQLVFAARWMSIAMAALTSAGFYLAVRWLTGNRVAAALVTLLFAVSPGLGMQAWHVDKDLVAMIFSFAAFLCIVKAARTPGDGAFIALAAAVCLMMLSMMSKLQVIFLVLVFPVAAFFFSEKAAPRPSLNPLGEGRRLAASMGAFAMAIPGQVMIWAYVYRIREPGEPLFHYQVLITVYLTFAVAAYARLFRGNGWRDILPGLAAIAIGSAVGMYVFFIYPEFKIVQNLVNPIEEMMRFVGTASGIISNVNEASRMPFLFAKGIASVWQTLARDYMPSGDTLLWPIYWALTAGILGAAFLREWGVVARAGVLLAIALGMEAFSGVRGWNERYFIYVQPWVFLSAAYLIAAADRRWRLFVWPKGATFGARQVAVAALAVFSIFLAINAGTAALVERPWESPDRACGIAKGYMPRLVSYFCPAP